MTVSGASSAFELINYLEDHVSTYSAVGIRRKRGGSEMVAEVFSDVLGKLDDRELRELIDIEDINKFKSVVPIDKFSLTFFKECVTLLKNRMARGGI
jgi:hypothetical protein